MMNTQKVLAAAAILAAAGTTFAQVGPGSFTPDLIENYEGTGGGRALINSLFGGLVSVVPGTVTHNSVNFGDWFDFRGGSPVVPSSGNIFGVQYGFGSFTLNFTGIGGITGFSFNASAAGVGADTVEFFDMAGNPMTGTVTDPSGFGPGDGTMEFLSFISPVPIGSVRLTGVETCFDDIAISTDGDFCVVSEGDFTPVAVEDYEGTPGGRTVLNSIFGGDVTVTSGSVTHNSVDFGNWSDFRSPGGPIQPSSGSKFGVGFGFGDFTLDFTSIGGIDGFQGMASAAGVGDDEITFFDMSGNELCTFTVTGGFGPGDGTMVPFSYVSSVKVGSVRLTGRETAYDDLGYLQPLPCPVVEGDFTAEATEDYEGTPGGRTVLNSLFGGDVPVIPGSVTHNSVDFGNWSDFRSPGGPIQPTSGTKFGVQFGFGFFDLDFTSLGGITGFKGNASAAGIGDDVVTFFDMAGNELCNFRVVGGFGPGTGQMVPFSYVSSEPIGRVRLDGRESTFDDLGYTTGDAGCRADCDGDGTLTIFDFLCFQNAFDAQDPYADFDGDGLFTIFDFLAFQNEFDAGCE